MFVSDKVEMRMTEKGRSIFAKENVKKGEMLMEIEKNFIDHPTKFTVQISKNIHQQSISPEATENFLNHSCEPNVYVDFKELVFRALRTIKKGEELAYNYLTTEWDMAEKFSCSCGSTKCFGRIKGFRYLSSDQKNEMEPLLSPFLKSKLKD